MRMAVSYRRACRNWWPRAAHSSDPIKLPLPRSHLSYDSYSLPIPVADQHDRTPPASAPPTTLLLSGAAAAPPVAIPRRPSERGAGLGQRRHRSSASPGGHGHNRRPPPRNPNLGFHSPDLPALSGTLTTELLWVLFVIVLPRPSALSSSTDSSSGEPVLVPLSCPVHRNAM